MSDQSQAGYPSSVEAFTPAFQSDVQLAAGLLNAQGPQPAIGGADDQQQRLLAFLKRRHPQYEEMLRHWIFAEETYNGGREWFKPHNIFRYIKEGDKEFHDRLARCYRFNHTREVTDLVQKYIFKSPVTRNTEDAPAEVKAFWLKATLSGLNIDQFAKTISTASSIFGRPWVFVDSTKTEDIQSKDDEKKSGVGVYAYVVGPRDILDIGFTDRGDVNWVLVRETVRDDGDPVNSSGAMFDRYRLWTRTEWVLYKIEETADSSAAKSKKKSRLVVIELDRGNHDLGEVPGFPCDHTVGDYRYSAPSLIGDIVYLDRAVANYLSNLDAIIQDQTFSQLAMPAQAVLPGQDAYDALVEMGTKRVFVYDGEGNAKPEYLSPDVKQARLVMETISMIIAEIYHTIGMAGERTKSDNTVGIDDSSGVAKAYDFERMNSLLTSKADSLENVENKLIRLVMLWHDKAAQVPPDSLVKYPDTFDVRSLFDEFTIAERLALVEAPDGVRQEQMKQVIAKLFPRLAVDLKNKLIDGLKDWPPELNLVVTETAGGSGQPAKFPSTGKRQTQPGSNLKRPKNAKTTNTQGQA
jgi:hypothetical protein